MLEKCLAKGQDIGLRKLCVSRFQLIVPDSQLKGAKFLIRKTDVQSLGDFSAEVGRWGEAVGVI